MFTWHLRVIKSCKTMLQLLVARKLLHNSVKRKYLTNYEYTLLRKEAYEEHEVQTL